MSFRSSLLTYDQLTGLSELGIVAGCRGGGEGVGGVEGGDAGHEVILSDEHVDTGDHWVNWTAMDEIWGEHHATLLPRIVSGAPHLPLHGTVGPHMPGLTSCIALLPRSARR